MKYNAIQKGFTVEANKGKNPIESVIAVYESVS
jgi:hypothetical protein